jgi:hypothetical protein
VRICRLSLTEMKGQYDTFNRLNSLAVQLLREAFIPSDFVVTGMCDGQGLVIEVPEAE